MRRRARGGIVLIVVSGMTTLILLLVMALLHYARIARSRSGSVLSVSVARIAAASGVEYAVARLTASAEGPSEPGPAGRGDDWGCREPRPVPLRAVRNPSYSHGEGWIDEDGDGILGASDALAPGQDRDGSGSLSAWSARLRGAGSSGCPVSLRIEGADGKIPLNGGHLRERPPDGINNSWHLRGGPDYKDNNLNGAIDEINLDAEGRDEDPPMDMQVDEPGEEDRNDLPDQASDGLDSDADGEIDEADESPVPDWRDLRFPCHGGIAHALNNLGARILPPGHPRRVEHPPAEPDGEPLRSSFLGVDLLLSRPRGGYRDWREVERTMLSPGAGYSASDVASLRRFASLGPYEHPASLTRDGKPGGAPYVPISLWGAPREVLESLWSDLASDRAVLTAEDAARIAERAIGFRRSGCRGWRDLYAELLRPDGLKDLFPEEWRRSGRVACQRKSDLAFQAVAIDPYPFQNNGQPVDVLSTWASWGIVRADGEEAAEPAVPCSLKSIRHLCGERCAIRAFAPQGLTMAPPAWFDVESLAREGGREATVTGSFRVLERLELACQEDFEGWEEGRAYAWRGIRLVDDPTPSVRHDARLVEGLSWPYPQIATLPGRNQGSVTTRGSLPEGAYSTTYGAITLGPRRSGPQGASLYWPMIDGYLGWVPHTSSGGYTSSFRKKLYDASPQFFSVHGPDYPFPVATAIVDGKPQEFIGGGSWGPHHLMRGRYDPVSDEIPFFPTQGFNYASFGLPRSLSLAASAGATPFTMNSNASEAYLGTNDNWIRMNCPGFWEKPPAEPGQKTHHFKAATVEAWMGPDSEIAVWSQDKQGNPPPTRYDVPSSPSGGCGYLRLTVSRGTVDGMAGTVVTAYLDWLGAKDTVPIPPNPLLKDRVVKARRFFVADTPLFAIEQGGGIAGRHHVVLSLWRKSVQLAGGAWAYMTEADVYFDGSNRCEAMSDGAPDTANRRFAFQPWSRTMVNMHLETPGAMECRQTLPLQQNSYPERFRALGVSEMRLYGLRALSEGDAKARYQEGLRHAEDGTYTSPRFDLEEDSRLAGAEWTGMYPVWMGAPVRAKVMKVLPVGYDAEGKRAWDPRAEELGPPGRQKDLTHLPPCRSFCFQVAFDCANSPVLGEVPVFESVWFAFRRRGTRRIAGWSAE